jgi:hypothetical protein
MNIAPFFAFEYLLDKSDAWARSKESISRSFGFDLPSTKNASTKHSAASRKSPPRARSMSALVNAAWEHFIFRRWIFEAE